MNISSSSQAYPKLSLRPTPTQKAGKSWLDHVDHT